ncbi:MAG TPA: ANTAR domain-containing protein [Bryobacteraceae bacterium]|jgi:uroporphyrinogen-III synthase
MVSLEYEISVLFRIGSIVSSRLSLDGIIREVIGLLARAMAADACFVYLHDLAKREIALRGASEASDGETLGIHRRLRIADDVARWVMSHNSVVALSPRSALDQRFKRFKEDPDYQACLAVPARSGGEAVGVLTLHHQQAHAHTRQEIGTVVFAAELLGAAITVASWREERARLTKELSEAKRELKSRRLVERAKGILQHRLDMSDQEAYLRLREQSRQSHKPMLDLAEAVILSEDIERHQTTVTRKSGVVEK